MGKRMTDRDKFRKHFYRSMPCGYKLLWEFIMMECNHAGIWITDFDLASLLLGSKVTKDEALKYFNNDEERVVVLNNGKAWYIPSYIDFHYSSTKNKVYQSAISELKKYGLTHHSEPEQKPVKKIQEAKEQAGPFNSLVKDEFYKSDLLTEKYLEDETLIKAVSKTLKVKTGRIKELLDLFKIELEGQSKFQMTPQEYAKYFRNWAKYQKTDTKHKVVNKDGLDWSLLSTSEQYSYSLDDQKAIIRERMEKGS